MSIEYRQRTVWKNTFLLGAFLLFMVLISSVLFASKVTYAAPGKINYQGRLTDATGAAKPDGQYNMKFRIYDAVSSGTLLWSETRETTSRVTVTNGQFSVQIGAVTPISSSVFAGDSTYFEVELPTPATATCSTAACGTFTEGAMTPRQPVSSSAYALTAEDSDTLDGLDNTSFAQISSNNTFTGTNLYRNSTNSAAAFGVQRADSVSLFNVNTTNSSITIGTGGGGAMFGKKSVGLFTSNNHNGNYIMTKYQTGTQAGALSQISAYISSAVDTSPNDKLTLAVYSDNAGVPGTLLATSAEGVMTTGWNTVNISGATLSPSTNYWLAYKTNTASTTLNGLSHDNNGGNSCTGTQVYANAFPASSPACNATAYTHSLYATFAGSQPAISTNAFGKVGIGTTAPQASFDVAGDVNFKNVSNTPTALLIQSSTASAIFAADTLNGRVIIGSPISDDVAVLLVLDTKNTATDPAGKGGAMYYNSSLKKMRCSEGNAGAEVWSNCTGPAIYRATSDSVSSTVLYTNVTGLNFQTIASTKYNFKATIRYDAALATTGVRFGLNTPSLRNMSMVFETPLSATTQHIGYSNAIDTGTASVNSAYTTSNIAVIEGIVETTVDSTVDLRFSSEVGGSAITVKAGSTLMVW